MTNISHNPETGRLYTQDDINEFLRPRSRWVPSMSNKIWACLSCLETYVSGIDRCLFNDCKDPQSRPEFSENNKKESL
jgi:hypothetical protein